MGNRLKCAISNIAWDEKQSEEIYRKMSDLEFAGIEIAPSKIFGENPYAYLKEAELYRKRMKNMYDLEVCSMQSIWYGRTEQIFRTEQERIELLNYTKRAIEFAEVLECGNLVFGCPKNRIVPEEFEIGKAVEFFSELGEYAEKHHTVLAMEANPEIYGTNFINYTEEAFDIVKRVNRPGFKVNFDFGTVENNQESLDILEKNLELVNHVHISRPYLEAVAFTKEHEKLIKILKEKVYGRYVSIEMKQQSKEYVVNCMEQFAKLCKKECQ